MTNSTNNQSSNQIGFLKKSIIADDFAMSEGVNKAILELCEQKLLSGASVMVTANFYKNYISELNKQRMGGIKIGLHLDFTFGKAIGRFSEEMVDKNGVFKNGFLKIFLMSFLKKKKMMRILYREANSQLKKLSGDIGKIDYIDGHQHIHTIPLVFRIAQKLSKKYQISRLRIINENFFSSFDFQNPPSPVSIIKFLVLKFCYLANRTKTNVYFYSILYSCRVNKKSLGKVMTKNVTGKDDIEIMVHPGYSTIDSKDFGNKEYLHLTSKHRDLERQQIQALNNI